jgi:signal transduction histidine kinase
MSLRIRLVLLTVALVALVAVALSALHLETLVDTLSKAALDRSEHATQEVSSYLVDHINQHAGEYDASGGPEALWYTIVSSDPDIASMLQKTLVLAPSIVEINLADADGRILASSSKRRVGEMLAKLRDFSEWNKGSALPRLLEVIRGGSDYQVLARLGVQGATESILTIQVVSSTVLLRDPLVPQVKGFAAVSGGSLLVALAVTLLATNLALRPLKRIDRTIDRIVQGNFGQTKSGADAPDPRAAKEFAILESKLNLLGQKFRGASEDATELRHDVNKLLERLASQLDVASRLAAISRLTGGVAHEIKNPLNAISLRLDFLRAKLGESAEEDLGKEELIKDLDVLSKEVQRLDRVVRTFLDFSRPVEVHFEDVDLAGIAREVADLMTAPANLARVAVEVESPAGPVPLHGDADLIKQAVMNLVTNAIEAMKDGGSLRLKTAREDGAATLEVADSGPGIPAALRNRVFQLYFTTKGKGSGIGLAMTYRAMQLHNGTIDFDSTEGRGTTFRLHFPATIRHA